MVIGLLLVGGIVFALIFFALLRLVSDEKPKRLIITSILLSALIFWTFSVIGGAVVAPQSADLSLGFTRAAFMYAAISAGSFLCFVTTWLHNINTRIIRALLLLAMVVGVAATTDAIIATVTVIESDVLPQRGVGYILFLAGILTVVGYGVIQLVHHAYLPVFGRYYTKLERRRLRFMAVSLGLGTLLLLTTNVLLPNIIGSTAPARWGGVAVLVLIGFLIYAALQYKLLDIRETVARSIAYVSAVAVLAMIYLGIFYIVANIVFNGTDQIRSPMIILSAAVALLVAFLFQPLRDFFDHVTNKVFAKGRYTTDALISRLGKIITSTTTLVALLKSMAQEISTTLSAHAVAFVVFESDVSQLYTPSKPSFKLHQRDMELLQEHRGRISRPEIIDVQEMLTTTYAHTADGVLFRHLSEAGVELMQPLGQGIGFLLLAKRRTNDYSVRDRRTIETIATELSVAIQNALSLEEVRELNATLKKRVDAATRELRTTNKKLMALDETKDEFISMASHQLRTPLTSIKGYISMVLEGDVGEITDQQRALLSESFQSSERMVHLISDFLNVSRLQTGKFMIDASPTNLANVVAEEVETLRRMANDHDITIKFRTSKTFPVLNLDENKLRQVVMNFIDNAIYYSPTGSTIDIKLTHHAGEVRFEVKDQGMGVPEEVQHRLFTKFFRADNARKQRPDGTGIGLYLAKKVITEQGGDIVFESRPGMGSTFGFRLPVGPLRIK